MSRLESQMEDALGIPPVPVAPNLAQQSADLLDKEIQQAEKDFGVIKPPQDKQIQLPKELESQIEESTRSPLTDFGTSDTFVDVLDNYGMKKDVPTPLRTELNERGVPVPVESLKPKLRPKSVDPTLPYGVAPESSLRPQLRPESNEVDENSFRGAIEYIINMGYLLQHPKTGKILTGLDASNKDHQAAIIGFFKQASPGFNPKKQMALYILGVQFLFTMFLLIWV